MSTQAPVEASQSPQAHEKKERKNYERGDKNEKRQHEKREKPRVRHERPAQYQRNAEAITVDTVLQPLPPKKQILPKPEIKDYQQKQAKNKVRRQKLIQKKKQVFDEKFKSAKVYVKGEGGKHEEFNNQIEQFKEIRDRFNEVRAERNAKNDLIKKLIDEAKQNRQLLKQLRDLSKNSRERVEDEIQQLEHRLITSDLSKQQEKALNSQIQTLKRKLQDAKPAGNIELTMSKAEQRTKELDEQINSAKIEREPLDKECQQLKDRLDSKNKDIQKIKGDIKTDNDKKTEAKDQHNKEYEDWKQGKKKRLDQISNKIRAIDEQNKNLWKQYHTKSELYWEQKQKIDFLQWQHRVKEKKIRDIEWQKKKLLREQKQKEREKQSQTKKYIQEIEACDFLVKYLKDLIQVQDNNKPKVQKKQQNIDISSQLQENAEWKKQKGLVVIQSKKTKQDEEQAPKKGHKKNKKKPEEEVKKPKTLIPFNIEILFDKVKVLPPTTVEQVEKKINELKEREALYERACSEEVSEADKAQIQKLTASNQNKTSQAKPTEQKQEDFPSL